MMKYLILDNIRSAYNVGAIFRTADGAGVDKVFLLGYTPTPIDRFGRTQNEIHKTSLGASDMVPWQHVENVQELLIILRELDCTIVAIEQTPKSVSFQNTRPYESAVYVLGNEITGVSPELLDAADYIIALPMLGQKESLNVSVVAGIILYYGII